MYSLNVPVPAEVSALAVALARDLPQARPRDRGEHTLVAKRLGGGDRAAFHAIEARAREVLTGQPAFAARVDEIDCFERASAGPSPVVYLSVESPGLEALHRQLCDTFEPVEDLEGETYVPHVTIARGGAVEAARRLADRSIDPIEWTVTDLVFHDADRGEETSRISLPA